MQRRRYGADVRQRGGGREGGAGERAREEGRVHHYEVLGVEWTGHRDVHSQQPEECTLPLPPSLLTANSIWHVHDDGLFLHARARA